MMNFHPENISTNEIIKILKHICKEKHGVFLKSGRYYHYYGNFLLSEKQWENFVTEFLMPTILVSPRYIGHRLNNGYCTLRLTTDKKYKPKIPRAIKIIN